MTSPTRLRRTFVILTAGTVVVFTALLLGLTLLLRSRLRDQVLEREAGAIHAVARMEISTARARLAKLNVPVATADVFDAVLESSRLNGVLAVQLFDPSGVLREALPATAGDAAANAWWPLPLRTPKASFHPRGSLDQILGLPADPAATAARTPLLEVVVPLGEAPESSSLGAARYWIDGRDLALEFRRLDRSLAEQAGIALAGGILLVVVLLAWTHRRLDQAQQALVAQSADLARANEELDFAAKTGALGAISAHLIHGLKNPLAGLEGFVAEAGGLGGESLRGEVQRTAMETTRRLRAMVNDVVSVLRDEAAGSAGYVVPLSGCVAAIEARAMPIAANAGVELVVQTAGAGALAARTASLAGLVLANLLTNAVEATPRKGCVRLEAAPDGAHIQFLVMDSGCGLPESVRAALFRPVRSTKPGGGGMGLAISARLARHAGGELSLVRSDARGTVFRLVVPAVQQQAG